MYIAFCGIIGFTSCNKDLDQDELTDYKEQAESMSDLEIDSDFDWSTTNEVNVTLETHSQQIVKIKTDEGNVVYKGMALPGVPFTTKISVPAYTKDLMVEFGDEKVHLPLAYDINYKNY